MEKLVTLIDCLLSQSANSINPFTWSATASANSTLASRADLADVSLTPFTANSASDLAHTTYL